MPESRSPASSGSGGHRSTLRADCERCFGLCCVAPAFSTSADFAISKDAGHPCPNLQPDFRCGIHARLRQRGFPGCAVYDCFGAGQKVAQVTFGGQDWRRSPGIAEQMFRVFTIMRQLHELLWYLGEALTLPAARPLYPELSRALEETERLTRGSPDALEEMLQKLSTDPQVGEISVLAHSLGNWVALEALRQMSIRNHGLSRKIGAVMLAAPDVDVDVFRTEIAAPDHPLMKGFGSPGKPMVISTLPSSVHLRTEWSPSSVR